MHATASIPRPIPIQGQRVGRYRLERKLATGGSAVVYAAWDTHAGEEVALKLIANPEGTGRATRDRFKMEARVASALDHPSLCRVLDYGAEGDLLYLALEYLDGAPFDAVLQRALDRGLLPRWFAAKVLADVARGVHAAHELRDPRGQRVGLVHGDVTPENIVVLFDGSTRLIDFGVARLESGVALGAPRRVHGKPGYLAPEQIRGPVVDRRADVWALGVSLWESTLGEPLFAGNGPEDTILRVLHAPIPRPRSIDPSYPRPLEAVVLGALERKPEQRTPRAADLAAALEAYMRDEAPTVDAEDVSRWMHTHMLLHDLKEAPGGSEPRGEPTESTAETTGSRPARWLSDPPWSVEESGARPRIMVKGTG